MKKIVLLCLTIILISYNYLFGFSAGFMGSGAARNTGGETACSASAFVEYTGTGDTIGVGLNSDQAYLGQNDFQVGSETDLCMSKYNVADVNGTVSSFVYTGYVYVQTAGNFTAASPYCTSDNTVTGIVAPQEIVFEFSSCVLSASTDYAVVVGVDTQDGNYITLNQDTATAISGNVGRFGSTGTREVNATGNEMWIKLYARE